MALQCRPGLALIGMTGVTGLFIAQPATMPTDGLWHHWCYTSNNSSGGLFYLDGVLATADPIQEAPPSAGVPFQSFLANDFNSDIFNGSLDDAAVYSGILTPTEVATLAAGGQLLSITQQPVTTYFPAGGGSANLVIAATAGATFQWRRNGVNISGATSATYTRAFVYSDHGARFDCVVTLSSTSITSNAVPAYMLGGFDVFLRSGLVQSRDVGLFDPTKATPSSALAGTAAGASTAAGALVGTGAFAATSAGAGAAAGTLAATGALAGSIAGAGTASATGQLFGAMAGSSAGAATAAGALVASGAAAGTIAGTGAASGAMAGAGGLAGTSTGAATASGTGQLLGVLAGTSTGAATVSAALAGAGTLAASSAGAATSTGTAKGAGALAASSAGVGAATATGAALGALAGSAAGASAPTGTLGGGGPIAGVSAGISTATGSLTAPNGLAGVIAGISAASGTMAGAGSLAAVVAGVGAAAGTVPTWRRSPFTSRRTAPKVPSVSSKRWRRRSDFWRIFRSWAAAANFVRRTSRICEFGPFGVSKSTSFFIVRSRTVLKSSAFCMGARDLEALFILRSEPMLLICASCENSCKNKEYPVVIAP